MEQFELGIGTIEFNDTECRYCAIYNEFVEIGLKIYEKFVQQVEECFKKDKDASGLIMVEGLAKGWIDQCIEKKMLEILINYKIYTYDLDTIRKKYGIYNIWQAGYNELCQKWQYYKEKNDEAHAKRERIKENRGRWYGGGFGVKGALKGAVTAGVLNGATGILYSIGNSVGNVHSDRLMAAGMQELFSNETLPESLGQKLFTNIVRLSDILAYVLNENGIAVKLYSKEETCKCNNILKNYSRISCKEERNNALLQCFKLYPFEKTIYQLYLKDVYEEVVKESEFKRMSEFFGQNIEEVKEDVIYDIFNDIYSAEDEEEKIRLIQLYRIKKHVFELWDEPNLIEVEQNCINVCDIVVDAKLSEVALLYQNEGKILKGELKKGEILISGNKEEMIDLLTLRKKMKEIYEKCDFLDRNSILEALSEIQNEVHNNGYQAMGQKMLAYLRLCAYLRDSVFDFCVIHTDNLESEIKNYKPGKFIVQEDIGALSDTERQEYLEKTYHYTNQGEKESLLKNVLEIKQRYENLDFKDEDAVNELQKEVEAVYQKTGLGKGVLDELEERKKYIDKCMRTVLDVEYVTREEAAKEREKTAGNRKYSSVEEAQEAKSEIEIIENELKKVRGQGSLEQIRCYKNLLWRNFATPSAQDRLDRLEKEIVVYYENLCEDIETYEMARKGMILWVPISVIVTLILFALFMASGIIGKIICFFIFCMIWNKVLELRESVSNFDKKRLEEKKQINNEVYIKNKSICLAETVDVANKCPACGYVMAADMIFCPICGRDNMHKV